VEGTSHAGGVARGCCPARRQKERKRGHQKQNKVTVLVLGAADVAFNVSVCCCYAFQWKSKAAMLLLYFSMKEQAACSLFVAALH
jgi:hypothetical protein